MLCLRSTSQWSSSAGAGCLSPDRSKTSANRASATTRSLDAPEVFGAMLRWAVPADNCECKSVLFSAVRATTPITYHITRRTALSAVFCLFQCTYNHLVAGPAQYV